MKSNHIRGFELKYLAVMSVLLCVAVLIPRGQARSAWTPPTTPPPGGNVAAPLNTSSTAQTKQGDLTLGGDFLKMSLGSIYLANPDVAASPGVFWASTSDPVNPHINFNSNKLYISSGVAGTGTELQGGVTIVDASVANPASLSISSLPNCGSLKTTGLEGKLECGGPAGSGNWTQNGNFLIPTNPLSNIGILENNPTSPLTVGLGGKFQVDPNGDIIRIKNVTYSWPSSNPGNPNVRYLRNDGNGNLTWDIPAGGGGMWEVAPGVNNIQPTTPGTTKVHIGWSGIGDDTQLSVKNNSANSAIYAKQNNPVGYAGYFSGKTVFMNGNVGIGVDNPSTKLEVVGGAIKATDGLIIQVVGTDPASPALGQMWLVAP